MRIGRSITPCSPTSTRTAGLDWLGRALPVGHLGAVGRFVERSHRCSLRARLDVLDSRPPPAWIGSNLQNILKGLPKAELYDGGSGVGPRNSPNTNSAEHTALESTYNLFAILAVIADLSTIPVVGKVSTGARWGGRCNTSLQARRWLVLRTRLSAIKGQRPSKPAGGNPAMLDCLPCNMLIYYGRALSPVGRVGRCPAVPPCEEFIERKSSCGSAV